MNHYSLLIYHEFKVFKMYTRKNLKMQMSFQINGPPRKMMILEE